MARKRPTEELTKRERAAYCAIRDFVGAHQYMPTYRQLGEALGVSYARAAMLVRGLVAKRYVAMDYGESRSLRLLVTLADKEIPVKAQARQSLEVMCPMCRAHLPRDGMTAAQYATAAAQFGREHALCNAALQHAARPAFEVGGGPPAPAGGE